MPRFFAVVISQPAGFGGMPVRGHCSSATTNASCASSSAWPISPVTLARPAMSRADSMRHTASTAVRAACAPFTVIAAREPCSAEVLWTEDLEYLALALPAGHEPLVQRHEP